MRAVRRRLGVATGFALLALVAELGGRELTEVVDRALHVSPLATPGAPYYPFLLVGVKVLAALALAALAARLVRAHATAVTGERLLTAFGQRHPRPWPRLSLSPRLWLVSFVSTSLWYLVQTDAGVVSAGRWPMLAPWLHTYALPVFAVLSVLVAVAWTAIRGWVAEYERVAEDAVANALRRVRPARVFVRPTPETVPPRRLFGLAFESR